MVAGTVVHIIAHMVNFYKLAMVASTTTGGRVVAFLAANFATGPGATGWIMTAALSIMVFFAREKVRRATFERFWYSHHLFIVFFICWQLHGMFCMIKPDRPPYCSSNTIGVFWVCFSLFCRKDVSNRCIALLAYWRCYLDFGAYPPRSSLASLYIHLQDYPTPFQRYGGSDQEGEDYNQGWSIHLPFLPRGFLLPMAPFHIDQVCHNPLSFEYPL